MILDCICYELRTELELEYEAMASDGVVFLCVLN